MSSRQHATDEQSEVEGEEDPPRELPLSGTSRDFVMLLVVIWPSIPLEDGSDAGRLGCTRSRFQENRSRRVQARVYVECVPLCKG
jgi:hypothetical protein